jgi:hypothetical protein
VNALLNNGADLFIRNSKGYTPLSSINNNLLMIKLLKKAEILQAIGVLQNRNYVQESHMQDKELIMKSIMSFAPKSRIKHMIMMPTFKDSLRVLKQYLIFPYFVTPDAKERTLKGNTFINTMIRKPQIESMGKHMKSNISSRDSSLSNSNSVNKDSDDEYSDQINLSSQ